MVVNFTVAGRGYWAKPRDESRNNFGNASPVEAKLFDTVDLGKGDETAMIGREQLAWCGEKCFYNKGLFVVNA
jgi:hypothetical protein